MFGVSLGTRVMVKRLGYWLALGLGFVELSWNSSLRGCRLYLPSI